jgi:hypothetical protein
MLESAYRIAVWMLAAYFAWLVIRVLTLRGVSKTDEATMRRVRPTLLITAVWMLALPGGELLEMYAAVPHVAVTVGQLGLGVVALVGLYRLVKTLSPAG